MGFFSDLWNGVKDVATRVFNTVKDPVSMVWNKVADPLLKSLGPVGNAISTAGNVGGDILTGEYKNAAKHLGKGLLNAYGNPLKNIPVVGGFVGDAAEKALGLMKGGKVGIHMMPDGKMMKDSAMAMGGMVGNMTKDKNKKGLEPNMPPNKFQK
jgi:hypothetical protein